MADTLTQAMNTSDEAHRHACEVRHVVNMPHNIARRRYIDGVAKQRGPAAADRLYKDVKAILNAKDSE